MRSSLHTAGWVMVNPEVWIQGGVVEVIDDRIHAVHNGPRNAGAIDHGPGVIMPALVNAHTHLSLSALHGRIDTANWIHRLGQAVDRNKGRASSRRSLVRGRTSCTKRETQRNRIDRGSGAGGTWGLCHGARGSSGNCL